MPDIRRRNALWGGLAIALFAVALLSATALTGAENEPVTRFLGCVLSAISLISGAGSLALAIRGVIRTALTSMGARLEKQTKDVSWAQERRHAELMAQVTQADVHTQATLQEISDTVRYLSIVVDPAGIENPVQSEASASFPESLHAQNEERDSTREQQRAGWEGVKRANGLTRFSHAAGVGEREPAKSLLNVVRSESQSGREEVLRFAAEAHRILSRIDDIETGQQRTLNYLRREGNIQVVLDRLQASERRILNSVEGGALTVADELTESAGRAHADLREDVRVVTEGVQFAREALESIKQGIEGSVPCIEDLQGKVGGIAQSMDALSGSMAELGDGNSRALGNLEDATTNALNYVEVSVQDMNRLQEEVQALTQNVLASQTGTEQLVGTLRRALSDVQTRWDALQQEGDAPSAASQKDFNANCEEQTANIVPEVKSLVRLTDVLKTDVKSLHRHVDRAGLETVRQTEALLQLLPRMGAYSRRLPVSGGFAMAPDSLLLLSDLIADRKPKRILEIGSGTSTIWIGSFAASIASSVISIDHLEEYRARTQNDLMDFGLDDTVDLRLAELAPVEIMGETKTWYDLDSLQDLLSIDLVVVDGPPESTGPAPRSPAFPLLRSMLSNRALLVVDDTHREQESQMVQEWLDFDQDLKRTTWEAGRTVVLEYRPGDRQSAPGNTSEGR